MVKKMYRNEYVSIQLGVDRMIYLHNKKIETGIKVTDQIIKLIDKERGIRC